MGGSSALEGYVEVNLSHTLPSTYLTCAVCVIAHPGNAVRLVGGSSALEGYVEVNMWGKWGAICSFTGVGAAWTDADAKVVCRQLGYPDSGATAYSGSLPDVSTSDPPGSSGKVPFLLSMVQCSGSEGQISACSFFKGVPPSFACNGRDAGEGTAHECRKSDRMKCVSAIRPCLPSFAFQTFLTILMCLGHVTFMNAAVRCAAASADASSPSPSDAVVPSPSTVPGPAPNVSLSGEIPLSIGEVPITA